ncbi:MAG: hypothetical protein IH840_10485, partial [Candidatus Heimdallarchaeota archaeon]|nr:hypothetical protein [Candidatus Heimdallarchaeota archaeon]
VLNITTDEVATSRVSKKINVSNLYSNENKVFMILISVFWMFYWLLNFIDKVIVEPTFLWAGRDRLTQFTDYFNSIGITNNFIVYSVLFFVSLLELTAFVVALLSVVAAIQNKFETARKFFFYTVILSLSIFTFFTLGDQVFGDRFELMEHTIYWGITIVAWLAYDHFYKLSTE